VVEEVSAGLVEEVFADSVGEEEVAFVDSEAAFADFVAVVAVFAD
jgi:hypothetical protein